MFVFSAVLNLLNFENEIKKFSNNKIKTKQYKLITNYRSTQDIVEPSNTVIQNNTLRSSKELHSGNPSYGICSYVESDHEDKEPIYIARTIKELKEKGHIEKYSDVAILFRSVGYKDKFIEALRDFNIPITRFGFDISKSSDVSYSIIKILGFIAGKLDLEEVLDMNFFVKKSDHKYISFLEKLQEDYFNDKSLKQQKKYDDFWGISWFKFSNPMYGAWEGAIIDFDYSVARNKKLELKELSLDAK